MKMAISEAEKALAIDEVPVGAVVVCGEEILAQAYNRRENDNDPTAHAEMIAIREAAKKRGDWRLDGCDIYVTKEPCPMCAGAIQQARFSRLIFGCMDKKGGYAGSLSNVLDDKKLSHQVEVINGIEKEKTAQMLKDFFQKKRIS